MINSKTLAVLFPNSHDKELGELTAKRAAAAIPFGGRYRLIDFPLSGLSVAGVERCAIIVNRNYVSLMDHIGNGREWDFVNKRGGISVFPPFSEGQYYADNKVGALYSILGYLDKASEEYVVLADCNFVANIDYRDLFASHRQSGADITAVYVKQDISPELKDNNITLTLDNESNITEIFCDDFHSGERNIALSVFVMKRTILCDMIREGHIRNRTFIEKELMSKCIGRLVMKGYEYKGYFTFITDRKGYYEANMSLLSDDNMDKLFPSKQPVYTKVRDDAPVRYTVDSKVINSVIADGSLIAGTVENSLLFRGVRVEKGAVVKNCVLMQDTIVESGAVLDRVITDKDVKVSEGCELKGSVNYPVYVNKGETV